MLRIPGSYNAKDPEDLKPVELLRPWDGNRPSISKDLLFDFYLFTQDEKIKELQERDTNKERYKRRYHHCRYFKK